MTGPINYPRTAAWRVADRAASHEFEAHAGNWLGAYKIAQLDATDKMDYWVPGIWLDVKEKRQPLSGRWPTPCDPVDCFILDELSIRRAMLHMPSAYFLMRDVPGGNRIFLARIDEIVCGERVRVNRVGRVAKGKWLIRLTDYRQLQNPEEELLPTILADQIALPWKQSALIMPTEAE